MDSNNFENEFSKIKLAYPFEYLTHSNFQERLNLRKKRLLVNTKTNNSRNEEINRTQESIKNYDIKNGQELTMLYLIMDVLQLADVFENFVEKATLEYSFNPLYNYTLPGYTWKAGLEITKIKLVFIKKIKNYYYYLKKISVEEFQV